MIFHKDDNVWAKEFNSTAGMVHRFMRNRVAFKIWSLAIKQVGKKTFSLFKSINYDTYMRGSEVEVRVGSDNKIARLHHEGSKPHYIFPKNATALRFRYRGKIVYRTHVYHPGTKPNRYLSDPMNKVISRLR